jgi:putative transposase
VDPERRAAAVERLLALRAAGSLTPDHVRLAAEGLGVDPKTVRRWIHPVTGAAEPARRGVPGYVLSEADREAFAYFRGNIAAVYRARSAVVSGAAVAAGVAVPDFLVTGWAGARVVTVSTLQRAFAAQLTPAERAMWREGENARRAAEVYLTRPRAPRNQVWELDHKQLPVLVLPPRGPAVCPWLTTVVDDGTRVLLGWALMITPHAGTVLTAVRMALTYDEARGPFGAVPALVRIDRGADFAAEAVRDALSALCVRSHRLPGYTPHRKGKVERIHLTVEQTLLCGLPGYTNGPRDAAGKLHGPLSDAVRDRVAAGEDAARAAVEAGTAVGPMRIERFAQQFAGWVGWYNTERPHAGLDGATPLQAWQADPTALQRISPGRLRHLLMAGVERTVGKDGVRFNGLSYIAPELQGRRGQSVHVRYMPHDDRSVEIYLDGAHLGTAYPQGHLDPEQVKAFRDHARAESRRLAAARRRAAAQARTELAPITDGSLSEQDPQAAESRLVPAAALTDQTRRRADAELAHRARSDLLGLAPEHAIPAAGTSPGTPSQGAAGVSGQACDDAPTGSAGRPGTTRADTAGERD